MIRVLKKIDSALYLYFQQNTMKNIVKTIIKTLKILPVINLLKHQKRVINELSEHLKFMEKMVAQADWHHGEAEKRVDDARFIIKLSEDQIGNYKSQAINYQKLIKLYEDRLANFERMTQLYEEKIQMLTMRASR